jgi:hypothetical protein
MVEELDGGQWQNWSEHTTVAANKTSSTMSIQRGLTCALTFSETKSAAFIIASSLMSGWIG